MRSQIKTAFVVLSSFFALIVIFGLLTNAFERVHAINVLFFSSAALFFLVSVAIWLFSWALFIPNRRIRLSTTVLIGFSCVFASLTPIQVGADALRSIKIKEHAGVLAKDSLAASMIIKGLKFFFIALFASISFAFYFFDPRIELWVKTMLLVGFVFVTLAAAFFLLPLNRRFGRSIAHFCRRLSLFSPPFVRLSGYFERYSVFIGAFSPKKIIALLVLAVLSLLFEFLAFLFSFFSANLAIPVFSALLLFSILSILERAVFVPRGIGVVEAAGFVFLSIPLFTARSLSVGEIGLVIILFDIVRIVIPAVLSLALYAVLSRLITTTQEN